MNSTKTKKVEIVIVDIKSEEKALAFEDLLLSSRLKDAPFTNTKGKTTELEFIEDKEDYVTGIVVTTKQSGLPAKRNMKAKTYEALGFNDDEGLVYGNAIIYDKALKVLIYEVNRNGTYIHEFINYIIGYCCRAEDFGFFNIGIRVLLNMEAYEKMMSMRYYKKIEFEIAQPTQFIIENESISNATQVAKGLNADYLKMEMGVRGRVMGGGLANRIVQNLTTAFMTSPLMGESKVTTLKISGIEEDPENFEKTRPSFVDLITDKYLAHFDLEEPRVASDVQATERKRAIKALYLQCKPDFEKIVALQNKL